MIGRGRSVRSIELWNLSEYLIICLQIFDSRSDIIVICQKLISVLLLLLLNSAVVLF